MKQPELGMKVAELRQQKGLTQEHLAEVCEVSTRTIQRIESGEVDPRAFTINNLSEALEYNLSAGDLDNENLWLAAMHLSSAFLFFLAPLIIWSWKKGQSLKIEKHGQAVLNFQITMILALIANVLLLMFLPMLLVIVPEWGADPQMGAGIGVLVFCATVPLILIGVFCTYQAVINTVRSLGDKPPKYRLAIPFIR
ncbi:MAG TPA: helix-turn-helix domain-containing protein [Anaerolineales bacterium]|nr:helix-turn-helix domain-containing protein [Anaerolineales bacterium]